MGKVYNSIDEEVQAIIDEENKYRFVKPSERCSTYHAGSSTCSGCDDRCFILTEQELKIRKKYKLQSVTEEYIKRAAILQEELNRINKLLL